MFRNRAKELIKMTKLFLPHSLQKKQTSGALRACAGSIGGSKRCARPLVSIKKVFWENFKKTRRVKLKTDYKSPEGAMSNKIGHRPIAISLRIRH